MLLWGCDDAFRMVTHMCIFLLAVCVLQVIMRDHTSSVNVEELLRHSQMELQWIQRQLATIAARNTNLHHIHAKAKVLSCCNAYIWCPNF